MPVVLDCDTGVDDSMAIFYGLLAPEIEVVAIGCVWGNAPVEVATENTPRLLEIVDQPRVAVAMGAAKPLVGPARDVGTDVHGDDGQGNTYLPPPSLRPSGESAAEQLVRLAHERPDQLSLVPLGPLTSVALALALDPAIASLCKEVVLMGGAFLVPGNAGRVGEANVSGRTAGHAPPAPPDSAKEYAPGPVPLQGREGPSGD